MYYILEDQYDIFEKGTVIYHYDGKLTCLNEISIPFEGSIPNSWAILTENEAHFLKGKKLCSRLKLHQNKTFENINQLNVGDDFITQNERSACKIFERLENSEGLQFVIEDSKSEKKTVCGSCVQLKDQDETHDFENKYYLFPQKSENIEKNSIVVCNSGEFSIYGRKHAKIAMPKKLTTDALCLSEHEAKVWYTIHQRLPTEFPDDVNKNLLQKTEEKSQEMFLEIFGKPFFNESFTKETLDYLSSIYHKTSYKKVTKVIGEDVFINCIKTQLSDYKPVISVSKPKQDLHIDFVELILQILNRECRENEAALTKIRNSPDLVYEVERLINDMTKMDVFLSKEKEILLTIISIYFHIVKSSEYDHTTMLENFIKIFNSPYHDIGIKIGASLCLSFIIKVSRPLLGEINRFLKNALENKSENNFNPQDIFIALGRISSIVSYEDLIVGDLEFSLKQLKSSKSPYNYLKNIFLLIPKLSNESMKNFETDEFIKMMLNSISMISCRSDEKKNEVSYNLNLNCAMTSLSIVCDLCDASRRFTTKISKNYEFMISLKKTFDELIEVKSSSDEQFLELVIFIYFNIFKSLVKVDVLPSLEDMIKCFKNDNVNSQIKIAAALNLCFMCHQRFDEIIEVKSYLSELCQKAYNSTDIYGFPKDEICLGLERISSVFDESVSKHPFSNLDDHSESSTKADSSRLCRESIACPECESSDWLRLSNEEYERCLLVSTSHMNKTLDCKEAVDCGFLAERMADKKIFPNFLINTESPICLATHSVVLESLIRMNNDSVRMTVLGNCETSPEVYERLLILAEESGKEVAALIASKIKSEDVSPEFNQKLLSLAFDYLKKGDVELFKCFMEKSTNKDGLVDDGDTLLIKIIRRLDLAQMRYAMGAFTFDVNTPNESNELPICIAATVKDVEKIELLRSQKDQTILEHDLLAAICIVVKSDLEKETLLKIVAALKY